MKRMHLSAWHFIRNVCACEHVVAWRHFVMKQTPVSSREHMKHLCGWISDLTPAAFYWYLGGAAFGAAGYTRRNPPTKSHHNGAARTCQQTVAQFLSRHRRWIISSHHFAGKSPRQQSLPSSFRRQEIDGWVFIFHHSFAQWFFLVLDVCFSNHFF